MENSTVKIGKTGKIYIPKEVREKHGTRFFIVPYRNKIILYDVPKKPVEDLIRIGEKLRNRPLEKLITDINEEAYNDIQ